MHAFCGEVRAELQRTGKTNWIAYDTLIAAQCVRNDITLVTSSNVSEFQRVEGLRWEDWAR